MEPAIYIVALAKYCGRFFCGKGFIYTTESTEEKTIVSNKFNWQPWNALLFQVRHIFTG